MVDVARPPAPPSMDAHMHTVAGMNGSGNENGNVRESGEPKYATGMIYPPPDIRTIIDRTALHVSRSQNPTQFEDRVRESQRTDPKFAFLNPADPYHAYYRHRIEAGEDQSTAQAKAPEKDSSEPVVQRRMGPKEPPEMEFVVDTPKVPAVDLDRIKLTALFFACRGPAFLQSLSTREGRNHEFEFLRPTHPLFGYFSRLVQQYKMVLLPTPDGQAKLQAEASKGGRDRLLEQAQERAEWERWRKERERKKKEDKEAERLAFAEIDWHDYAIVQTIEFTIADAQSELPPPMTMQDIENMTLAQKRMAQMINESTTEDIRAANAAADARAKANIAAGVKRKEMEVETEPEEDVDMDAQAAREQADREALEKRKREEEERRQELSRAKDIQARSLDAGAPMKIRENYVPKGIVRPSVQMTTCPTCGQQVPADELTEHMRIELLDPRWKTQRDNLEARRAQAAELQQGANVAASLQQLARTRVDIFGADADETARRLEEEAEKARAREREKVVWDGHTASKTSTMDKFQTNVNFDEQIAAIHRAKGLGVMDPANTGPGIGPSAGPSMGSAPLPPTPTEPAYAGAVISAGPQPASAPIYGAPPSAFTPAPATAPGFVPPGMHPSRMAALGAPAVPGATDGTPVPEERPAKRQRIERYEGHVYSEPDWIAMHPEPITVSVQLPTMPDRPEWHLDGTVAEVPDLPLTLLVSTLRDRIVQQIGSSVPVGRIRLSYNGKTLTNAHTIAVYNLEDGDVIMLSVRDIRRRNEERG